MKNSLLHQYISSIPSLITELVPRQWEASLEFVRPAFMRGVERIYLTGCGDSHHAAVASAFAFEQLTGIPCFAQTAMQLSRYSAPSFPEANEDAILVIGISASGEVSRTVEALEQSNHRGAKTVALTANNDSTLAREANYIMSTSIPPSGLDSGVQVVPGSRSYYASLISLYTIAIAAGLARNLLSVSEATGLVTEISDSSAGIRGTIESCSASIEDVANEWIEESDYVFCGAGPNYGTAMFSAAKLLEACGDAAIGQDTEEWAHLQYFAGKVNTPTFVISGGPSDRDRAMEVLIAAKTIGRQTAVISPEDSPLAVRPQEDHVQFDVAPMRESFSPLLTAIPGLLFAAERAHLLGEPYFRDFGGGRSKEGGGGISRIRTSNRIQR